MDQSQVTAEPREQERPAEPDGGPAFVAWFDELGKATTPRSAGRAPTSES
jgi:hypothetical protein